MNRIIYARVSTDEQRSKGHSLPDQVERLIKDSVVNNHPVVKVFEEDHSAKDFNRPRWKDLLEFVKQNKGAVDEIYFTKWCRFSRNAHLAYDMIARLKKLGIKVQSLENPLYFRSPNDKILLAVYVTMPEVDNDNRSIATAGGMRKAMRTGYWVNTAPIGYKNQRLPNGKPSLILCEKSTLVEESFSLMASGFYAIAELHRIMREKGLRVSRSRFYDLLTNVTYTGKIYVPATEEEPSELIEGLHPGIIPEHIFNRVQLILSGRSRKMTATSAHFPLKEILHCHNCHRPLTGSFSKGRSGKYGYYHCNPCRYRVSAVQVEETMDRLLGALKPKPSVLNIYRKMLEQGMSKTISANNNGLSALKTRIQDTQDRMKELGQEYLDRKHTLEEYKDLKALLAEQLAKDQVRLQQSTISQSEVTKKSRFGLTVIEQLDITYQRSDIQGKKAILGSIFPEPVYIENDHFRTADINLVLSCFTLKNNDLLVVENEKQDRLREPVLFGSPDRTIFEPLLEGFERLYSAYQLIKRTA